MQPKQHTLAQNSHYRNDTIRDNLPFIVILECNVFLAMHEVVNFDHVV
jgi:hypothetical protein